jgi:hypothetical protein
MTVSSGGWRKSSHSGGGNDCVEVALTPDTAAVRDSKDPEGGVLSFSARGWAGLLAAVGAAGPVTR